MYITITAQKLGENFSQSVADFVAYLEKENKAKEINDSVLFFNQYDDNIPAKEVIFEIDYNMEKPVILTT